MFDIKDATINTGVFRPKGYQSIWLFVTENKTKGSPQYTDLLYENLLYWDGQTEGHTDHHIISHAGKGFEILVFYRAKKREFPHGGFKYEGRFRYVSHEGSRPTQFVLERVAGARPKKDSESLQIIERHDRGEAKVIPVILRPINGWQDTPIGKLQALPKDAKPVVDRKRWPTVDYALENVASGIKEIIDSKRRDKRTELS